MVKKWVTIDDREVELLLADLTKFFSPSQMKILLMEAASLAKFGILKRTAKGQDVNLKYFSSYAPYAPMTYFFRQKKGRPTNKVDLFFTGRMLGSLTIKATPRWARLYFPPSEAKKAIGHQEGIGRLPKREFFGLTAPDVRMISKLVSGKVEEVLRGNK